jgi:hypothetical protein
MYLQSWMENLINTEHDIILSMDTNDTYNPDVPGTIQPLIYTPDKLTMSKTHDGKLATLVASCGLKDLLASRTPIPSIIF